MDDNLLRIVLFLSYGPFVLMALVFLSGLFMKWLGDPEAYGIFEGPVVKRLVDAVRLQGVRARKIGEDFLLEGYVKGEHPCSQGL